MNILLIEDEVKVASVIKRGLEEYQNSVTIAYDGVSGYELAMDQDFDLVLLDVMLPKLSGLEVCKKIRRYKSHTPIFMLTAVNTIEEKVLAFDNGADDYLTKPFHFKELLARVKAIERRGSLSLSSRSAQIADLKIELTAKRVYRAGKEILLSAKEYKLLELLMIHKNRVVSRAYIAEEIWGTDFDRQKNVIDVYVSYLRTKVDKGHSKQLIHTAIGMGYILKEEE